MNIRMIMVVQLRSIRNDGLLDILDGYVERMKLDTPGHAQQRERTGRLPRLVRKLLSAPARALVL